MYDDIKRDIDNGMSYRQAAAKHGVSVGTVARAVKLNAEQRVEQRIEHAAEVERDIEQTVEQTPKVEQRVEQPLNVEQEIEHLKQLPPEERMKHARALLTSHLWLTNPQRYTELRVALLGPTGTALPPGSGAFGMSSSIIADAQKRARVGLNR